MNSVFWLTCLILCITLYSNMYGSYIDRLFWNLVCLITLPLLFWMVSYTSNSCTNFVSKVKLMLFGVCQFFVSRDKSWKTQPDPDLIKGSALQKKRVVFIRHGESDWNLIFNKGLFKMPFRLVIALFREVGMLFSYNSSFYDSPLNEEGITQAKTLQFFLENPTNLEEGSPEAEIVNVIRGTSQTSSVVVVSNLRRAIATTMIGMWPRLQRTGEKVFMLSQLQEVSRNVDTLALARAGELPECSRIVKAIPKFNAQDVFDLSNNTGNKPMFGNGLTRLRSFGEWIFSRDEDVIIVGGHSLYFRFFFKEFLPHHVEHQAKTKKIKNSGVISFEITRGETYGKTLYRIEPESIVSVYGGFENKKKK